MRTRSSSSNLVGKSSPNLTTSNLKCRNRIRLKQPFILKESLVDTKADQRIIAELLRAPTDGYAEAIVIPPILAGHFELKHSLINMMTSDQFFRLKKDNPHDHIRWFNKITSTIKYKDVPNSAFKLMLFPFSLTGAARCWLEKEPPRSILTWEDLVSKFIYEFFPPSRTTNLQNEIFNFQQRFDESFHEAWDRYKDLLRACPHHGFTKLHQLDTFYNTLNPIDQDSLNYAADGNMLERRTQDVLTIIKNKSKCLAANGNTFLEFRDNIQGYVSAAVVNYNQGNSGYRPLGVANQIRPPVVPLSELEKIKKMNEINIKAMQTQINNVKNKLRNEIKTSIQASMSNQTNVLKNMMASFFLKEHRSTSGLGPLPSNTLANPKDLLSNKEKLLELENTPLNENCSAVILKKLPEKLGDPGKFLILCGFSELKCKALADLANRAICTPAGIVRDVFVPVGRFTFMADFVIVDYESDPKMPLILGRPFLRTARALIDLYGEDMILRNGDERLTLNMRHDTSSYSNQPKKESINMINIYDDSCEDYLEDFTTSSSPDHLLKEFADELALNTFPSGNDDLSFDIESDLREIEYLLNHDPTKEMDSIFD
nr:reverse transcriptase domain-containing protein [Tanacetum cinerariifolium]